MTRGEDWETDTSLPAEFWRQAAERTFAGRRGQKFLAELEDALVAWPSKKLAQDVLVGIDIEDGRRDRKVLTGEACAIGVLALAKGKTAANFSYDPDDQMMDTCDTARGLGATFTMAWTIAQKNDDIGHGRITAEERYEKMLEWVRACRAQGKLVYGNG